MNYIEQIRGFWRSHEENSYTPTDIALYFHLLEINNICMWKNQFKRNNAKIQADLGISFKTLQNARNRLQQYGLLTFKNINGNPNVTYSLVKFPKGRDKGTAEVLATKDKPNQNQTKPNTLNASENLNNYTFENFWEQYDKKIGNPTQIQQQWNALTPTEQQQALNYIPHYKQAEPEKRYRKRPEIYLTQKTWNDELINRNTNNTNGNHPTTNNKPNTAEYNQTGYGSLRNRSN